VKALELKVVRAEFYKRYPADGDTEKQRQAAKKKAFKRAIDNEQHLVGVREIEGVQYVWHA
jgi:hypothetical protein